MQQALCQVVLALVCSVRLHWTQGSKMPWGRWQVVAFNLIRWFSSLLVLCTGSNISEMRFPHLWRGLAMGRTSLQCGRMPWSSICQGWGQHSWCWSTNTRTLLLGEEWAAGTQDKELLPFSCQPRVWLSNAESATKETEAWGECLFLLCLLNTSQGHQGSGLHNPGDTLGVLGGSLKSAVSAGCGSSYNPDQLSTASPSACGSRLGSWVPVDLPIRISLLRFCATSRGLASKSNKWGAGLSMPSKFQSLTCYLCVCVFTIFA